MLPAQRGDPHRVTAPVPPLWSVVPFFAYLLAIATVPLFAQRFWEGNRRKLAVAAAASLPVLVYLFALEPAHGPHWLLHSAREYAAFIALLGALFTISGGVHLRGSLAGTPLVNTAVLAAGALLASFIGTTGASMLLIRPLLRANAARERRIHIVVFFIFIVSNAGGLLTPLGDPPLFLGFLRGVPFLWTLRLFPHWLLVNGLLLALFHVLDQIALNREERLRPGSQLEAVQRVAEPLRIEGGLNFVWLLGVLVAIFALGAFGRSHLTSDEDALAALQILAMLCLAGLSLATTPRAVREANHFAWAPIAEVAAIFSGIFVTMIPALRLLEARGAELGVQAPWHFFWASGLLSSILDNAPTYLAFASLAVGVVNEAHPGAALDASALGGLLAFPDGVAVLTAISTGSVLMGANTYIGNGPNFMVKAIAESAGVRMPGFFGYMAWSGAILLPIFALVTRVFFR
jgi:Na+/H+ antiporter NhaD/arsenite permease-like protein